MMYNFSIVIDGEVVITREDVDYQYICDSMWSEYPEEAPISKIQDVIKFLDSLSIKGQALMIDVTSHNTHVFLAYEVGAL